MAVTALSSQLQALAVAGGQVATKARTKASLLFTPAQAADIDLQTIFALSQTGLDGLVEMDRRFEAYKKTLFSAESLNLDREMQSRGLNDKLNSSIATFLRVLSSYIMLTPAHQVLEYLIRRYKIHVYNVDDFLISIFPYHETSLFVRIVQLLQLKKTKWEFLEGIQKTGAAPPRAALVHRCMTDMAMLDALCEAAIKVARIPTKTRTIVSFTSIVVMEMLAAVPSVTTSIINKILPFVLHGFEGGITEEYRVGALMVVATLANRTPLSPSLLENLIDAMARTFHKESEFEGAPLLQLSLMVMIQLMQTQDMDKFPAKAFKFLVKVRNFNEVLAKLVLTYDASKFLSLFLTALVQHSASHEHYEQALVSVINAVAIKDNVAQLVTSILELYMGKGGAEDVEQDIPKEREVAKRLMKALERRYSTELDSAVSLCLQQGKGAGKGGKGSAQQEALREMFLGSLHMPLAESNSTLYLSLDHPEARVREVAVRQLAELDEAPTSGNHTEMNNMMCEALLRRAHDDDFGVIRAVLAVKSFVEAPVPERLFKVLASIISKCVDTISSGSKAQQAEAKGTATVALKVLASRFLELHPSFTAQVASVLFSHLLVSPKTLKLNLAALKLAGKLPFALYEGLSQLQDATPGLKEGTKTQKEELRLDVNEKVVSSLAARVLQTPETLLPVLLEAAAVNERAKCLVLLVISRVIKEGSKDLIMEIAKPCLLWVRGEWATMESGKALQLFDAQEIDYEATGATVGVYKLLDTQPTLLCTQLLLKTLYQLLERLPVYPKAETDGSDVILKQFYELFVSGSAMDKFSPHLQLLLRRLSANVFAFLSKFLTPEGSVSSLLHSHSLDLLASYYRKLVTADEGSKLECPTATQLQVALPSLIVGLANPVQDVRRSAAECLQQLYALSEKLRSTAATEAKESLAEVLKIDTFDELLKALVEAKSACTSDEKYVAIFLASLLDDSESQTLSSTKASRFKPSARKAIVNFLMAHALRLSTKAQGTLVLVLQGTGHEADRIGAISGIMEQLLERRSQYHLHASPVSDTNNLSPAEVDLLDILLQMYTPRAAIALSSSSSPAHTGGLYLRYLLEAMKVEGGSTLDRAVVKPCVEALGCLTSEFYKPLPVLVQEQVFQALIDLSPSTCAEIHAAAHGVLQNLKVPAKITSMYLRYLCNQDQAIMESPAKKKRKAKPQKAMELKPSWSTAQQHLSCAAAMLEVLSWLPDTDDRQELVAPLYELLKCTQSGKWPSPNLESMSTEAAKDMATSPISLDYIQQLILISLERLAASLLTKADQKVVGNFDIKTVVRCVAEASDSATRNQALALLTAIAKVFPDKVLKHVVDILSIIGTSTITQNDSYSHEVTQELLVAVVPCWLTTGKDPTTLLQVIVTALPQVPAHRRMALVTTLLRVTKEKDSLHLFLLLLLGGATGESDGVQAMEEENKSNEKQHLVTESWEVQFAEELCQQYEPHVWLPALVKLLKSTPATLLPLATQFVATQLQSLSVGDTQPVLQEAYVALLEQALVQLQLDRKENQVSSVTLLDSLTAVMAPTTYLEGMASLLQHPDTNIRRKVLRLYTTRMKMQDEASEHPQRKKKIDSAPMDNTEMAREHKLQARMVSQITQLLLGPTEDASSNLRLAAVEALEKCAKRLADTSSSGALVECLPAVVTIFDTNRKALCAAAVRCVTTLLCILGPRGLPSLPNIISQLLLTAQHALPSSHQAGDTRGASGSEGSELILSILKAVEAIMENLGAFLSPYLGDIISLVVLQPSILAASDANVTMKAAALRSLIPEKIPARLLLDPLVGAYTRALEIGEEATIALFQMLAALASKLDRASVPLYHSKIFNVCLQALDLRHNRPKTFASVAGVETWVVTALVSLILKLSENSFKPLFVSLLDWAQPNPVTGEGFSGSRIDRNIAFYRLVNQLTEKLRSLFVPYFSFLLDGIVRNLTGGQAVGDSDSVKPKKKKKKTDEGLVPRGGLSLAEWHLRQLLLSSLHKCFLYDTVSFLDGPKFQQLLGPIVSQVLVDPPPGVSDGGGDGAEGESTNLEEMDDALVSCLSQMALTAGTDLLWKPLNHEVLMCSRSEKLRPRLLALRVVKLLAEQLKEEYLVLLPETLPFLAELLEDSELNVVAKTQEVVKLLEDLSGESLSQYF